jgi:phosphopantetheine--protein transferase-like protein
MKIFFYDKLKNHTSKDTDFLINKALCGYFGKEVSAKIIRTSDGKPCLEEYSSLHVGVTHTDNVVLIALNEKPFGIDCEAIGRTAKNISRIAEKYFSDNERAYVFEKNADEESINTRFLEIWVKKEAYVKYTGKGLRGMSECDVTSLCGFKLIKNTKNLLIYIYEEN